MRKSLLSDFALCSCTVLKDIKQFFIREHVLTLIMFSVIFAGIAVKLEKVVPTSARKESRVR